MNKFNINIFLNGKFIFQNNPGKRALFHLLISGPIIIFGGIIFISGQFPPPENFEPTNKLIFFPFQILSLLWIWWFLSAFFIYIIPKISDKVSNMSEKEIRDTWQIGTGSCPYCLKKISKFAKKCPHCTADL